MLIMLITVGSADKKVIWIFFQCLKLIPFLTMAYLMTNKSHHISWWHIYVLNIQFDFLLLCSLSSCSSVPVHADNWKYFFFKNRISCQLFFLNHTSLAQSAEVWSFKTKRSVAIFRDHWISLWFKSGHNTFEKTTNKGSRWEILK